MNSIFTYTDYRKYLNDWYLAKKDANNGFSHRIIALKVGFRSAGHFSLITTGKASISIKLAMKFASYLKLKSREAEYFQYMVLFNQAKTHDDKKLYFEKMKNFKESTIRVVEADNYEYFDKWYHAVIRALLEFVPVSNSFEEVASLLTPTVPFAEVTKSIELLKKLGLIVPDQKGQLHPTEANLSTGYDMQALAITNYLIDSMKKATEALDRFPREKRNISSLALGISEIGFTEIQQELREFRRRVMEIAERNNADRVYQLSFQFFPLSKPYISAKGKKS